MLIDFLLCLSCVRVYSYVKMLMFFVWFFPNRMDGTHRESGVCSARWKWCGCCDSAEWCANWIAIWSTERPCWSCCYAFTCWWPIGWPAFGTRSAVRTLTMASSTVGCGNWPTSPSRPTPTFGRITAIRRSWSTGRLARPCTSRHSTSPWRVWPASVSATWRPKRTTKKYSPPVWWSSDVSLSLFTIDSSSQQFLVQNPFQNQLNGYIMRYSGLNSNQNERNVFF